MQDCIKQSAKCNQCGLSLPLGHKGPCPKCGGIKKTISLFGYDTIKIADALFLEKRREFFKKEPLLGTIIWVITFVAPCIGLLVSGWLGSIIGLFLGILTNLLGPLAVNKVIEIERYHKE